MKLRNGRSTARKSSKSRSRSRRRAAHRRSSRARVEVPTTSAGDMSKVMYRSHKVSKSYLKNKKKFAKKVEDVIDANMPINKVLFQVAAQATTSSGDQAVFSIAMLDRGQATSVLQELTGSVADVELSGERFYLSSGRIDGFYTNISKGMVILDWYLLFPRNDDASNPIQDWNHAMSGTASGGEASGFGSIGPNSIGVTPFMSSEFCKKWLIVNKRRVMLQPGETKEFHRSIKNKDVVMSKFQSVNVPVATAKGLTSYYMVFAYGQPAVSGIDGVTVGTGTADILYNYNICHTARGIQAPFVSGVGRSVVTFARDYVYPSLTAPQVKQEFDPADLKTD